MAKSKKSSKKPSKRARASKVELEARIEWFERRIGRGLGTTHLIDLAKKEFGVEERQAYTYHELATTRVDQRGAADKTTLYGHHLNDLEYAKQKALVQDDLTALAQFLETQRKTIKDMQPQGSQNETQDTTERGLSDQLEEALRAIEGDGKTH